MRDEYDFSNARRGAVAAEAGAKTRITAYLDTDVLEALKAQAEARSAESGVKVGYQTVLNQLLRDALALDSPGQPRPVSTVSVDELRRVVREEFERTQRQGA